MPPYTLAQIAKAGTATVGAAAAAALGIFGGDSAVGVVVAIALVVGTAVATYLVPNAPTVDAAPPVDAEIEPH